MADSKMDEATLEALRGSIAKWEGIVAGAEHSLGSSDCPLCERFNPDCPISLNYVEDSGCNGCPVYEKTKRHFCGDTPYSLVADLAWKNKVGSPEYIAAAQAELDFLKSLLPVSP